MKDKTTLATYLLTKKALMMCLLSFVLGAAARFLVYWDGNRQQEPKKGAWNGGKYEGEMEDGEPNGNGTFERNDTTWTGTWTNGIDFEGTATGKGFEYDGKARNLKFDGYGVCRYADGQAYWGYWKDGKKDGLGRLVDKQLGMSFGIFRADGYVKPDAQAFTAGKAVYGIDVSHHQEDSRWGNTIKWQDLYLSADNTGAIQSVQDTQTGCRQPVLFVYAKCTEGAEWHDGRYVFSRDNAHRCGILFGSYHFYTMTATPEEQARNFMEYAMLAPGDLPPVLDLEKNESRRKISNREFAPVVESAKKWLRIVEDSCHVRPVIYTNMNIYRDFLSRDSFFSSYDLWIAALGDTPPDVPRCVFWQKSHTWKMNGIAGGVDVDVYLGKDYGSLVEYVRQHGVK